MRKVIVFLLSILLTGILVFPAAAAEPVTFTISSDSTKAIAGDKLQFEISADSHVECTSFGILLEYDPAIFTVLEGECTVDGTLLGVFDPEKGFAVLFENPTALNGTVGTFTLQVKNSVPSISTTISGQPSAMNGSASLDATVSGASVTLYGTGTSVQIGTDGSASVSQTSPAANQESEKTPVSKDSTPNAVSAPEAPSTGISPEASVPETSVKSAQSESGDVSAEQEKQPAVLPVILLLCVCAAIGAAICIRRIRKQK